MEASFEIVGVVGDVKKLWASTTRHAHGFHSQHDQRFIHGPSEDDS